MIGAFVVFSTVSGAGLPPVIGVLISVVACTLLGMAIERIAYKPLRKASKLAVLITAIGVSYFSAECSSSDLRSQYEILYLCRNDRTVDSGRRSACNFRRDDCDGSRLYHHNDWSDDFHEIFQIRTGHAGSVRGQWSCAAHGC